MLKKVVSNSLLSSALTAIVAFAWTCSSPACAQDDGAVVRGKIDFEDSQTKSWDGNQLVVPFPEIQAKLRETVVLPQPELPAGFMEWSPEKKLQWEQEFVESEAGKKFLEERKQLIENANSFDLKFESDGSFVVYDVPAGIYGIQGRVDKEIDDTKYAFEVFGQIEILKEVDELVLPPIRVEITPLMQRGQPAPPIAVKSHDDKLDLTIDLFGDDYLFVNFWTSLSPTAPQEQKLVQELYAALKPKHGLRLLSINIDEDREKAIEFIKQNKLKGSHGFTNGFEHRTIFDYGVRSFPSFWLIGKDDKVLMTQYEIAMAMRIKPDMQSIISDRIEGKDEPTPAEPTPVNEKQTKTASEN